MSDISNKMYVVRLYDGFDNEWMDISKELPYEEARKVWLEKTNGGKERTNFNGIDYYHIFPADTAMRFSEKGKRQRGGSR